MKIACVSFSNGLTNVYDFFTDVDVKEGDLVVCDTSRGYNLGTVVDVQVESAKATNWIVQKIDLVAHEARIERQKRIKAITQKMEKRRKSLEQEAVYRLMAKEDAEMAELLKQLEALKA